MPAVDTGFRRYDTNGKKESGKLAVGGLPLPRFG